MSGARDDRVVATGTGTGAGCCGELVQGTLPDGAQFQVTLPIDLASTAVVELRRARRTSVEVAPRRCTKAARAVLLALSALGAPPCRARLHLRSPLPTGAGMGSSTADVVAAVRAVADALGATCAPALVGRLAGAIEASDGTMYGGVAVVDRRGGLLLSLPWWPRFHVVALVPDRAVDTAEVDLAGQRSNAARYRELLDQVVEGASGRDASAFLDAARTSAALNQPFVPNRLLGLAPGLAHRTGALGWNVAHTGSALGLFFDDAEGAASGAADLRRHRPLGDVRIVLGVAPAAGPVPVHEAVLR